MKQIKIIPLINPVESVVDIPASKSLTNRALVIAASIKGDVVIQNPLYSDDTKAMIACLKTLGIEIEDNFDSIIVKGDIGDVEEGEYKLDAKLSGTTIRFILALSCITPGIKIISGDEALNKRPIGELAGALKDMGAEIEYLDKSGYPPLKVTSNKLTSNSTVLHGDISSQFFTALLLIAPNAGGMEISVMGNQISKPYLDMTFDLMKQFGVDCINEDYKKYKVEKGKEYKNREYKVEGDYSSAGYFIALSVLTKSKLVLKNLDPDSKQADKNFLNIIEKMGNKITFEKGDLIIEGKGVKPINIDMENCPDQVQTLAVMLAFGTGKSVLTGVRSLRVKETERVLALQAELLKMGIKTESEYDSLTIYGGDPNPAEIDTYSDHRMAMSFALAGTVLSGMIINNPEVVTKTFPDYWDELSRIGVNIEYV